MTTAADEIVDAEWVEVTSEKVKRPSRRKPLRLTPALGSVSSKPSATPSSPSRTSTTKKKTKTKAPSLERKSRAASASGKVCPLCGTGAGSVDVKLGPLVVKVCQPCASPILNVMGLLDWWNKR